MQLTVCHVDSTTTSHVAAWTASQYSNLHLRSHSQKRYSDIAPVGGVLDCECVMQRQTGLEGRSEKTRAGSMKVPIVPFALNASAAMIRTCTQRTTAATEATTIDAITPATAIMRTSRRASRDASRSTWVDEQVESGDRPFLLNPMQLYNHTRSCIIHYTHITTHHQYVSSCARNLAHA